MSKKRVTVNIGNDIDQTVITGISQAIESIFKSGFDNRMEQATIREAIHALSEITRVEGVNISHSTFHGDKTVNMDDDSSTTNS